MDVPPSSREFTLLARGFGTQVVKSDHPADATHYSAHGILPVLTRQAFPDALVLPATVEFGTLGPVTLLRLLRAENRSHYYGARRLGEETTIRKALREALAPLDHDWRANVIAGGRQIFTRLLPLLTEMRP